MLLPRVSMRNVTLKEMRGVSEVRAPDDVARESILTLRQPVPPYWCAAGVRRGDVRRSVEVAEVLGLERAP